MKANTRGAWIISHSKKLQAVTNLNSFEELYATGKSGIMLSALAESENNSTIDYKKVKAIAKEANIHSSLELPSVLNRLKDNGLIDTDSKGNVSVLGLTTSSVLQHTASMFDKNNPQKSEKVIIEIAEDLSNAPKEEKLLKELVGDTHKMASSEVSEFFTQVEDAGLLDYERMDKNGEKM